MDASCSNVLLVSVLTTAALVGLVVVLILALVLPPRRATSTVCVKY